MTLPMVVVLPVLLAALLHAGWNAAVKLGEDRLVVMGLFNIVGLIIGWSLVMVVPFPPLAAWPFIILSGILHNGYYFFLLSAYKHGDLSRVYPLSRGASPLLVAGAAAVLAGEWLSPLSVLAVLVASAGIVMLTFEKGLAWHTEMTPVLFALGTAAFIASYTVTDGLGVRRAGHALSYVAWLVATDGIPIVLFVIWKRGPALARAIARNWLGGILGGSSQVVAYGLVIWAMGIAPMAFVSALRETSVLFAALIATTVLHERLGWVRIVSTVLVLTGVVLLKLTA